MDEQITLSLHDEIRERWERIHSEAANVVSWAVEIGALVKLGREQTGDAFGEWCKDLPFPERQAERFERIYDRREELEQIELFNDALLLLDKQPSNQGPRSPELQWAKYSAPLNSFIVWAQRRKDEAPVSEWPPFYRRAVADKLKPVLALYQELTESLPLAPQDSSEDGE